MSPADRDTAWFFWLVANRARLSDRRTPPMTDLNLTIDEAYRRIERSIASEIAAAARMATGFELTSRLMTDSRRPTTDDLLALQRYILAKASRG